MRLGEIIRAYRTEHHLSQQRFADMCSVSKSYISLLENGKTSRSNVESVPSIDVVSRFAKAMGISVDQLLRCVDEDQPISLRSGPESVPIGKYGILSLPETKKVPRLGAIACGKPILAEENIEGYDEVPVNISCDFSLECKGNSMTGARIMDGDIVLIRSQPVVEDGEIAAVLIDGEATLKRVRHQGEQLVLWLENPTYSPMIYSGQQLESIRILGKAIAFLSYVR